MRNFCYVDTMSKTQDSRPLELNKTNLQIGLQQYNYFPFTHDQKEEMPPIFNSEGLNKTLSGKLLTIGINKARKGTGFDVMPFKRTRHPNIPRMIGIPHPMAYLLLVNTIVENWEGNIRPVCQSENSNLQFEIQSDFRILVHSYHAMSIDGDVENHDPSLDFGMSYRVKTDISNFYHSIYSHALPWALVGHQEAKKTRHTESWYNKLDADARRCQRNETKGITIGPATSSILSEIILFKVDEALREKGYKFSRYVDDYTAYTDSKSNADAFLVDLAKELDSYALTLNHKKTEIREMPTQNALRWVIEMNQLLALADASRVTSKERNEKYDFKQLRLIVEKAVLLSSEHPDGSVVKYAFSAILERGVEGEDAEKYLQDNLLKYAFYFPALVPLIHRWSGSYSLRFEINQRLHQLYHNALSQGQTDNAVWCIYYMIRCVGFDNDDLLAEVCEDKAPIVMLMGYVYAKNKRRDLSPIQEWAKSRMSLFDSGEIDVYDIDKYWLVFYQLYLDDVIDKPPYSDNLDNKVFEVLKKAGMSFIKFDHPDLETPF